MSVRIPVIVGLVALGAVTSGGAACGSNGGDPFAANGDGGNGSSGGSSGSASGSGGGSGGSSSGSTGGSSGSGSGAGSSSGSGSSSGGGCPGYAAPGTASTCTSCTSGSNCQANGCYGGWYCNTSTNKCEATPGSCSSGSSSGGSSSGGLTDGGAVTGTVGSTGGSVSRLYFAVVGDTRPPNADDTSGYPTAIATKIFQDLESMSPRPSFGVSTGDYMYVNPGSGQAAPQLDLYVQARGNFSNVMFPTMGNHECTGYTSSNCGSGTTDGETENYKAFLGQLLQPLNQSNPYYSINVNDSAGKWTAKFVFVAGNAWTSAQSSWLDTTLSKTTTYTFLVRHEPKSAGGSSGAPGVDPAEAIMAKYPYTLSIVGHSHLYEKSGSKEVIFGNGGAPLSSGTYGFGLVQQLDNGDIQIDDIDYTTMQPDTKFRFTVSP